MKKLMYSKIGHSCSNGLMIQKQGYPDINIKNGFRETKIS